MTDFDPKAKAEVIRAWAEDVIAEYDEDYAFRMLEAIKILAEEMVHHFEVLQESSQAGDVYHIARGVLKVEDAANAVIRSAQTAQSPSAIYKPKLIKDGDMWCALYGEYCATGVYGFGKTPYLACEDFNENWGSEYD